MLAPKKKKKVEAEEEKDEPEEEEKPEWLDEKVEIDNEEKIKLIRSHILLPFTAPKEYFTFGKFGRAKLAEPPKPKHEFYDANICLEHPEGFRMPHPDYIIDLGLLPRYEGEGC